MYRLRIIVVWIVLLFYGCNSPQKLKLKDLGVDSDGKSLSIQLLSSNRESEFQAYLSYGLWGQNRDTTVLVQVGESDTIRCELPGFQEYLGNAIRYQWNVKRGDEVYQTQSKIFRIPSIGVIPPFTPLEVENLFKNTLVVDGLLSLGYHADSMKFETTDPGERGVTVYRDISYDQIVDTLKSKAGVDMATITISSSHEKLKRYVRRLDETEKIILVRTSYDIDKAYKENKLAIMCYSQKHYPINNNPDSIDLFYQTGLRIYQLVYGASDKANTTPKERLGAAGLDVGEGRRRKNNVKYDELGLTPLGEQVIIKLNDLNIIVDCSHCSEETIYDAIKVSKTPVIINHSNTEAMMFDDPDFTKMYGVNPKYRGLSDSAVVEVAKNGGIIGAMPVNVYLDTNGNGPDLDDLIVHINHMVRLINNAKLSTKGADHISLASDASVNGWPWESRFYPGAELSKTDRWKAVIRELSKARDESGELLYTTEDLKKIIGDNATRIYRSILKGHSQPALKDVSLKNNEITFKWKPSKVIDVDQPKYSLLIYGQKDDQQYHLVYKGEQLEETEISIPLTAILKESNIQFKNYKWFVKANNNLGETISNEKFFNINLAPEQVIN